MINPTDLQLVSVQGDPPLPLKGWPESTLENVLSALQKEDELFDHNVPEEMRNPSQKDLQEFLVKTYQQRNFTITDPATMKKQIKPFDWVQYNAKEPHFEYASFVKPGMQGEINHVNSDSDSPLSIIWDPCEEFEKEVIGLLTHPTQILPHTGEDLSLLPHSIFRRRTITDKNELLAIAKAGMRVESRSEQIKYHFHLPIGATGIITEHTHYLESPVKIIFGRGGGYVGPRSGYDFDCKYEELKLIKENPINLREILRKI